jgi:hypothetical protein
MCPPYYGNLDILNMIYVKCGTGKMPPFALGLLIFVVALLAEPSASISATPTRSPFVGGILTDNTNRQLTTIASDAFRTVSTSEISGVQMYFPEEDETCGPGSYVITVINLPMSCVSCSTVLFNISLYASSNSSLYGNLAASMISPQILSTSLRWITFAFSGATLPIDTVQSRYYTLTWSTRLSVNVRWHDMNWGGGVSNAPSSSLASAYLPVYVSPGVGWSAASTYGGQYILGRKTACSPTPSQSASESASSSPSMSPSPSTSLSSSATTSMSPSQSASQSTSQSNTASGSSSMTTSATMSQSASLSLSSSQSPTQTITSGLTRTSSKTKSSTQSRTRTSSPSQLTTRTPTQSLSSSQEATPSASFTATPSQFPTMVLVRNCLID